MQIVMWGGFGLLFGELAERLLNPKPKPTTAPPAQASVPSGN